MKIRTKIQSATTRSNTRAEAIQVQDSEAVSPATRLLEKRRKMYENQEAYKAKKAEFQKEENQFKASEQVLREKDGEIQNSLIAFSSYLDGNRKQISKAKEKINQLAEDNRQTLEQIARKEKQLRILDQQSKRIEKKRIAVESYQMFLEKVKNANPDQYDNIKAIIDRHKTLQDLDHSLNTELRSKEQQLNTIKYDTAKQEHQLEFQIMQLNNKIQKLKKKADRMEQEKNKIEELEQASSQQNLDKISQISRIMMMIDHLEAFCKTRKLNHQPKPNEHFPLSYDALSKNRALYKDVSGNFDDYAKRKEYCLEQLDSIKQYLFDFDAIIKGCDEKASLKPGKTQGDSQNLDD